MNEALELEVGQRILEVGSGSGWHAATVAEVVAPSGMPRSNWGHVYTTEIIQGLAEVARKNIMKAGYADRVTVVQVNGSIGYPEAAPYDRICVTAAAPKTPDPLVQQLKPSGLMLIPIGSSFLQSLIKIRKERDGILKQENLGGVAFVPLTGEYGQA